MYCTSAWIKPCPCTCYGCHTNTEISVCSMCSSVPISFVIYLCMMRFILSPGSLCAQYDTPRTRVAESQMGSQEGMHTESQSVWRLNMATSPSFSFTFSTHPPIPFNPVPSLPLSLSPVSFCLGNESIYMCVTGGCNMCLRVSCVWSHHTSAYRTKFNLH